MQSGSAHGNPDPPPGPPGPETCLTTPKTTFSEAFPLGSLDHMCLPQARTSASNERTGASSPSTSAKSVSSSAHKEEALSTSASSLAEGSPLASVPHGRAWVYIATSQEGVEEAAGSAASGELNHRCQWPYGNERYPPPPGGRCFYRPPGAGG